MKKYIVLLMVSSQEALQYRFEAAVWFLYNVLPPLMMILLWLAAFRETDEVAGYSFAAFWLLEIGGLISLVDVVVYLVGGTIVPLELLPPPFRLVADLLPFKYLFYASMTRLSELVNKGELDFVLIKPMSSQFLVSMRYVTFDELPSALAGVLYALEAARRLGLRPGPWEVAAYLGFVLAAILSFYALWFLSVTLVLWTGRIKNIAHLIDPFMDLARVPTDVFAGLFRPFFTFVIPIALIATIPSKALLGLLDPSLVGYAFVLTAVLLVASNRFWNYSLRRYSSASS